ncbi:MAG: DUF1365 domain-containing protein [Lautropia sp.]
MPGPLQIAFGTVRHRRIRPWANAFAYRAFFLRLRIDAPSGRLAPMTLRWLGMPLLGIDRPGLLSFRASDHGPAGEDALAWVRRTLAQASLDADGEIWLHCFARVLGHAFKPVSFWFCHRADGALIAVLAEVNNTFGDRRAYLLHDGGARLRNGAELVATKDFHVSPFCETSGSYRFRFVNRADRCLARIDHDDAQGVLLQTSLSGAPQPLTRRSVAHALLRYPVFGLAVVGRIHWQALRLWWHGVRFVRRPEPPQAALTRPATGGPARRARAPAPLTRPDAGSPRALQHTP